MATANMLVINPLAEAVTNPGERSAAHEQPVEVRLVRAVLDGDREGFGCLYDLYAPLVHGILLARVPRAERRATTKGTGGRVHGL